MLPWLESGAHLAHRHARNLNHSNICIQSTCHFEMLLWLKSGAHLAHIHTRDWTHSSISMQSTLVILLQHASSKCCCGSNQVHISHTNTHEILATDAFLPCLHCLPWLPALLHPTLFPFGRGGMGKAIRIWIRRGTPCPHGVCDNVLRNSTIRARASLPGVGYPDSQTLRFPYAL